MDIKEIDILGPDIGNHWYYNARAMALSRYIGKIIPSTIIDIGAGSGFFSEYLLQHNMGKEAWCVDIGYENDFDVSGKYNIHFRRHIDKLDADLVILMDVLEHVDNDVALLKEYLNKVPNNCRFIITVPAFNFLWSSHDDFLKHKRRYTLNQLEDVVKKSGLNVKQSSYFLALVFPIAASIRLAEKVFKGSKGARSQLRKHNPVVNAFLKILCHAELPFMKINRLAGLTIYCLAEKS